MFMANLYMTKCFPSLAGAKSVTPSQISYCLVVKVVDARSTILVLR
jgi:hypothetical protein